MITKVFDPAKDRKKEVMAISTSINNSIERRKKEILLVLTKYLKFFKKGLEALQSYDRQFQSPEIIKSKIDSLKDLMNHLHELEKTFITSINYEIHDEHDLAPNLKNISDLVAGLITTKFDFERFKRDEISAQDFVLFFSNKLNQYERLVRVLESEIQNVQLFAKSKKYKLI